MKTKIALAAAALAFVAAAPAAQASFKVIKWDSGMCQVWNNATPWNAGPVGWHTVSRDYHTLDSAFGKRHRMINKSSKQIRKLRGTTILSPGDAGLVRIHMPYAR